MTTYFPVPLTCSSLGREWPNRTSVCTVSRKQQSNERRLGSLGRDLRAGWQKSSRSTTWVEFAMLWVSFVLSIVLAWNWNVSGVFQTNCCKMFLDCRVWGTSNSHPIYLWSSTIAHGFCLFRLNEGVSVKQPQNSKTESIFKLTVKFDCDSPQENEKAVKSSTSSRQGSSAMLRVQRFLGNKENMFSLQDKWKN